MSGSDLIFFTEAGTVGFFGRVGCVGLIYWGLVGYRGYVVTAYCWSCCLFYIFGLLSSQGGGWTWGCSWNLGGCPYVIG